MFKQRKVNKPERFTSRFNTRARKKRDYLATIASTSVVQFILFCFLLGACYQSFVMMRDKVANVAWYIKYAVPGAFIWGAVVVGRTFLANIARVRALRGGEGSEPRR